MILRKSVCSLFWMVVVGFGSNSAVAQGWADKLFDSTSHDFGYVARGGQYTKAFTITNKLDRPLHISDAKPSCVICTVTSIEKKSLEPGESTVVEAAINTVSFTGPRSVAVTVYFDQPVYGQTRLTLQCNSRSDIVISPGEAALGTVKKGTESNRTITIAYAGDPNWRIASATCSNPYVNVDLKETRRDGNRYPNGKVDYVIQVRLTPDAPPGPIRDRIILGINDAYNKSIDLALQANIQADLSLSPPVLTFGSVPAGRNSTKQVLVHGVRPFCILGIDGDEGPFEIEQPAADAKQLHALKVKLKDGQAAGTISQDFKIKTDMAGEEPLKLSVSANLIPRSASSPTVRQN